MTSPEMIKGGFMVMGQDTGVSAQNQKATKGIQIQTVSCDIRPAWNLYLFHAVSIDTPVYFFFHIRF